MPDDFNFSDDDNLMPDWMRDSFADEEPAAPSAPSGAPPWDQHPGEAPPPPAGRSAAPPWETFRGPAALSSSGAGALPPWGNTVPPGGFAAETSDTGGDIAGWGTQDETSPGGATDELPQGMTGTLPWREEAQPPPRSPIQRIGPADEPARPTPSAQDDAWLDSFGFGDAARLDSSGAVPDDSDDLDWLQGSELPPAEPSAAEENFAALFDEPQAAQPGADDSDFDALLADTFSEPSAASKSSPAEPLSAFDDLTALFEDEFSEAGSEPLAEQDQDDFAWMDDETGDEPDSETPEPEPPAFQEPPRSAIRRITPAEGEPPRSPIQRIHPHEEEPAQRPVRRITPDEQPPEPEPEAEEADMHTWLSRMEAAETDDSPADSGMTYEEWERSQAELEHEAQKTEEDRLLESGPDWFSQVEAEQPAQPAQPAAPPQETGPEFVPNWFLGLDETPDESAPDWFKQLDFSADALSAPVSDSSSTEPVPVDSTGSAPDWFTGAALPGIDDSEWQAAFGAPSPPPEAAETPAPLSEPPSSPIRRLAPAADETPEPPAESVGWLADAQSESAGEMPMSADDFEPLDFEAGDEGSLDDEFVLPDFDRGVEEEAAPGDVPDWLSEAASLSPDEDETPSDDEFVLSDFDLSAASEAVPSEVPQWLADTLQAGTPPADEEFPLPDTSVLAGLDEEAAAAGEVPDWLTMEWDARAEPADVSLPDIDLDQSLPVEPTLEADLFAGDEDQDWMADFALTEDMPGALQTGRYEDEETREDFVERFDPIEADMLATPSAPLDEDAPAWLREMAGEMPDEEPDIPSPPEMFEDVQPAAESLDWLSAISAEDVESEAEMPADWEEAAPSMEADAADASTLDSLAIDELLSLYEPELPAEEPVDVPLAEPEWPVEPAESLLDDAEVSESEEAAEPVAPLEIGGVADWEWMGEDAGAEIPDLQVLFDDAPFESIEDEDIVPSSAAESEGAPSAPEGQRRLRRRKPERTTDAAPDETHPEWVAEMRPSDLPVVVKAGGAETSITQKQVIELPDRLRTFHDTAMREAHDLYEKQPASPPADSGPLAGITGALPVAALVLDAGSKPVEGVIVTPEQRDRLSRLEALLSTATAEEEELEGDRTSADSFALEAFGVAEAATEEIPRRARRRRRAKPDRVIAALLLLAALVVPFVTDTLHFASNPPPLNSSGQTVSRLVDDLAEGQYVLFAMEYGPTSAGELDPLAQAVLRDVLAQGAIPLTISTDPAGAFHAQAVIRPLAGDAALLAVRGQEEPVLAAGEDYVVLRFLAGEAIGVRSLRSAGDEDTADGPETHLAFKTDLRGEETGLRVSSLEQDIALIVVVSAESSGVRIWAEQLNGVGVPKIALVTASAEPLTIPYLNEDGYAGYLAGVRDTYSYNAAQNADSRTPYTLPDDLPVDVPNPDESQWHSMALGAAVASALIALGLVVNVLRGVTRRRR